MLQGIRKGLKNAFVMINSYFNTNRLGNSAPSMIGTIKGFVSKENIVKTHCFIHRESLVAKTAGLELKRVIEEIINIINYINARPFKPRIFENYMKRCNLMR